MKPYKKYLKTAADLICYFINIPSFIIIYICTPILGKDSVFWGVSQMYSMIPGRVGCYVRNNLYRLVMTRCSKDSTILFGTLFSQQDTEIGNRVYIGPGCNIGTCRIEDDCTVGSGVHILSGNKQHKFKEPSVPVKEQGGQLDKITIGADAWVGNGAIIMAEVGKCAVIGAGAVVTKPVEPYSIVAGNPARKIGERGEASQPVPVAADDLPPVKG